MHACRSAAARLPDLCKRGSEIGILEVAESVEVDADVDVGVDLDGDGDGDVEIQHNVAQHSTAHHSTIICRPCLKSVIHPSQQMDGLVEEDKAGLGWRRGGRCTSSTRPPGSTSISRVTRHTGGRLFSCGDTF
jgi:hypothetical protein